jgi:hypothetical protein
MGEKQTNNRMKMRAFFVALFFALLIFFAFNVGHSFAAPSPTPAPAPGSADVTCGGNITNVFECVFKMLIYGIFVVFGWLAAAAAVLFAWVVDAKNISGESGILNATAIKNIWIMTRDTLNMFFILVLLFAAFCTIFQVEKWNLKKVWLNVLINALLVNFSYTIARFIIDISNVMMYYFFTNMFQAQAGGTAGASGIMAAIGGASGLAKILIPPGTKLINQSWAFLIMGVIFMFIFAITLLVVAIMFVIRLIALTIIVMFSPIGFVGYIFPSTHKFADDWWSALFKYAFFGPIMAFMMSVSLQMMVAFGQTSTSLTSTAMTNVPAGSSDVDSAWLAKVAFFSVPVIILWVAMGISQKMGIAGASAVVGNAKAFSKAAGMKFSGANWAKKQWGSYKKERDKRREETDKKNLGSRLGGNLNDFQDEKQSKYGLTEKSRKDAQKRFDKRKDTKNKDDIKAKAEEKESIDTNAKLNDAVNGTKKHIQDYMSGAVLSDDDKIDRAGHARASLNDKNYTSVLEKDIKDDIKNNFADVSRTEFDDVRAAKSAHRHADYALESHDARRPDASTGATAEEIASWTAERSQLKDAADKAYKKVESEEKKTLQDLKTKHMDNLHKIVQAGEDVKKIKPRP